MTLKSYSPFLWLAAFLCSLFFINDWQLELFAAATMFAFVWAIVTLTPEDGQGWRAPQSWVLRIMGLFWLLVFLSIFHSAVLNISVMSFCFFSAMPLTFLVFAVRGEQKHLELLAKILAVIFTGLSVWALLQFFVYGEYFGGRAHHPLADPNALAALLSLGFFCALGLMLGGKSKGQSNIGLVLSILIFGGIIATGSRGALFAMLPFLGVLFFVMRGELKKHRRCLGILFALCAALFAASLLGVTQGDNIANRMADMVTLQAGGFAEDRLKLWAASVGIIKEHGLSGTGIGTYFLYYPEFRLSGDLKGTFYAHNDPLQYWVELGILGPVLFYAFVIAVTGRTVQAMRKAVTATQRFLIIIPFCALGAAMLHTHITFNLYNLSILFSCGFLLAVWFHATQIVLVTPVRIIAFPDKYSMASRMTAITLPFLCIGGLYMAYIISEHYTNKARDHLLAGELEEFANDIILANKVSFHGNSRTYLIAVNVPLTLLENPDKIATEQKKEIFDQGLFYLRHVRRINPRSSSALFYLAKIQQLAPPEFIPEDLKSPEEYYREALAIDPLHIGARMELAAIYEKAGEEEKAFNILNAGADYKYISAKAMDLYAQLMMYHLKKGDKEGREKMATYMRGFQFKLQSAHERESKPLYQHLWGE